MQFTPARCGRRLSWTAKPNYYDAWLRARPIAFNLIMDAFAGHISLGPLVNDPATASQDLQGDANPAA
jgi:hypothetical protein